MEDAIVPIKPKQLSCFYEPLVLYKALNNMAYAHGLNRQPPSPPKPQTEEERFHRFVNRLATMCDNVKGGSTVTGLAILEHENATRYVFGCNRLPYSGLEETADFLTRILTNLSGFNSLEESEKKSVHKTVLKDIIGFNRPRIRLYMLEFKKHTKACLESYEEEAGREVSGMKMHLQTLVSALDDVDNGSAKNAEEKDYVQAYRTCLKSFAAFIKSPGVQELTDKLANEHRTSGTKRTECWADMRHKITRLHAYWATMDIFIAAERDWPGIFQEVKVIPVPYTKPDENPLWTKNGIRQRSSTADAIIGRMFRTSEEIEKYRGFASELQAFNLNDRIVELPNFQLVVHAEVQVLAWITANCLSQKYRYAHDFKYIGSSKPTCKLCDLYFKEHHSRTKVRPSHGNLYPGWKFPNIFQTDGPDAIKKRQEILNSMKNSIRKDASNIMESKLSMVKRYDSNTYTIQAVHRFGTGTDLRSNVSEVGVINVDELTERLRSGMGLESTPSP